MECGEVAAKQEEVLMRILYLFLVLGKLRLLSLKGLYQIALAIRHYGINVMVLLKVAACMHGPKEALVDEKGSVSYRQLLEESERLSILLKHQYGLGSGRKVGFLCKNHASFVKAVFAVSLTGADLCLLHPEMSLRQFNQWLGDHDPDLLVYDAELTSYLERSSYAKEKLASDSLSNIDGLFESNGWEGEKPSRTSSSRLQLMTGGTTGVPKKVEHRPSLFDYLPPFYALLTRLPLLQHRTAYIATPLFHGYGIAFLFLLLALGKKIVLTPGFHAEKACDLIRKHEVGIVTAVPLMIQKILKQSRELPSLGCLISGGAQLHPKLAAEVFHRFGDVLYNLYGTSEAGINLVATPQDLRYSPQTLGQKVPGARLQVRDGRNRELGAGQVGQFCIKNSWSMRNRGRAWIETGDLGYRDRNGYYFLCGRTDDLIVSAGENVYPLEIEQALIDHPDVEDAVVIGIRDEAYGQRLRAIVQPTEAATLTPESLMDWLRPRLARYQLPKEILLVDEIPYTHLGKRDKKLPMEKTGEG